MLSTIAATLAAGPTTMAQSGNLPAVRVLRDLRQYQTMWPADFNRDGITDLVSSSATTFNAGVVSGGNLQISIGKGDGTFNAPVESSYRLGLLGVGDFNGDGKVDVIADTFATSTSSSSVVLLPGTGTATLGAPVTVAPGSAFALSADLNGDGKRDLVLSGGEGGDGVMVYPGNGDFTFGTPATLPDTAFPIEGILADFNGDGRRDIAVANEAGPTVSVFLNQGALLFTAADISIGNTLSDVTAADVNGDGRIDLLGAASSGPDFMGGYGDGIVVVLPGNGNGTFAPPVLYPVGRGARQIVAGDFNRDGITDIATANRSSITRDDCALTFKTWDSVSILRGNGNGTFTGPAHFSIGDQSIADFTHPDYERYRNTVRSLNTSDLNGDRFTDLIASSGAVLLNAAATTNRPPSVDAGPDTELVNVNDAQFRPMASDPDDDMLTWEVRDETGRLIAPHPEVCWQGLHMGDNPITVTVDDGHGHRATDTAVYTVVSTFPPDVIVEAPTLGETVQAAPYTIRWSASAGGSPIARFDLFSSSDNSANWTAIAECTGLSASARQCVWQQPGPPSTTSRIRVHATDQADRSSDGVSPPFTVVDSSGGTLPGGWSHGDIGNVGAPGRASVDGSIWTVSGSGADIWGTADEFHFAYRQLPTRFEIVTRVDTVQNVQPWTKAGLMIRTSLDPSAPQASIFVSPGKGIAFQRRRSQGAASVSTAGPAFTAPVWLRLTGFNGAITAYYKKNLTDEWTNLGRDVLANYTAAYVGLAVTSHADGTVATATFSNLRAGTIPAWSARAIGTSSASAFHDGTNYSLFAQSSDIWGTADAFSSLSADLSFAGEATIIARVTGIDNTSPWAKAGVMFRESTATNSKHVFAMVTPGKGVNLQYRSATGGQSFSAASIPGVAPGWLRLRRSGNTFTASWSTDGITFADFGTVTVPMANSMLGTLAMTSHNPSVGGGADFEDVQIVQP